MGNILTDATPHTGGTRAYGTPVSTIYQHQAASRENSEMSLHIYLNE